MKTLYLDCSMGAAGDMLTAALFALLEDQETYLEKLNALGLPGVAFLPEKRQSHGISGVHMKVTVDGAEETEHHHHSHRHLGDIYKILDSIPLPEAVTAQARRVYARIAEAEARVHGEPVELVHFHEVGALDAVADVTAACYALYLLNPQRVVVSPIHTGFGTVHCAHGLLPVPAPATALLLEGAEIAAGEVEGELCTPTGAALATEFATEFGRLPAMRLLKTGTGIGAKEFSRPNCLRAFWGEEDSRTEICELVCTIDDMSPEALAFACRRLLEAGALDVYTTPGVMKKGRAGQVLTVLCAPEMETALAKEVLRETSTQGLRLRRCEKIALTPKVEEVTTPWGQARVKIAEGFGITHKKPEFEDAAQLARRENLPFSQVWETILGLTAE